MKAATIKIWKNTPNLHGLFTHYMYFLFYYANLIYLQVIYEITIEIDQSKNVENDIDVDGDG